MFSVFSALAIAAVPALAQTPSATYNAVAPSLALVVTGKENSLSFGTAFCIANSGSRSYYITSRHVISNDRSPRIVLSSAPSQPIRSAVVRAGSEMDAAILEAPRRCVHPLTLSGRSPDIGSRVAIAGFPSIQVRLFLSGLGLSPSFHAGAISSLLAGGSAIEYDAQTDHGNSGSPIFDPSSGVVYGIATWVSTGDTGAVQNNIAISSALLSEFIRNAHVNASFTNGPAASVSAETLPKPDRRCLAALANLRSADIDWYAAYRRATALNTSRACPTPRIKTL